MMVAEPARGPTPRRSFLWSLGAWVVGLVLAAGALVPSIWVFIDPLLRKPRAPRGSGGPRTGPEGFVRVAPTEAVPADGLPHRFAVFRDQVDAWNYFPQQPVGAVYVRRLDNQTFQVFQAICPHAGCTVAAVQTAEGPAFHCPCHNSSFAIDGKRMSRPGKKNPSPRDLDELQYQVIDGELWVEYKEFYTGRPEKVAKT
ncbi:MAG: hypothetical protein KatS3mg109_1539 [Pirellulaceae bacterium]|nr:MAG: hypothetical protein KatS3mg109_1539 [Pirellulaceae bacterium]GIW93288.1 MAG: hypothetical protein KatS3mg110_1329 [Pirellulaceae bacterium]